MSATHSYHKNILPLLMATVCTGTPTWADETVNPDYAAFVEAAAYVCTGTLFNDVPDSHWACGYIEEFANLNITSGCGGGNFCPEDNVTRAQMAVFLVKGLEETLYAQLDGPGSGLDADLLDGQDSSYYLDWNNFMSIPADLLDGDDDTLAGLSCASGEIAKWNGSAWACAADDTGAGGDITAVTAGTGLNGGGTTGDVALSADTTYLQRRVSASCTAGSSIRAIAADGTVTCETDNDSGGDITSVISGTGLNGGAISGNATLNVDVPLILSGSAGVSGSSAGIIEGFNSSAYGYGIQGSGALAGGFFKDSNNSGIANVGDGDYGIKAGGNIAGGYFADLNSSNYAYVGYSTYKILGSGTVSFVQNHPENKDEVIVYASPEGDEVATYTRGSARLVNGEARIPLGETFKWVTNPDIGLTAHLTPVGEPCVLYVAETSTSELLVKGGTSCSEGARFNYIVYGLRIGFEDITIVQKKTQESRIPSMADHRKAVAEHPELAQYTALSRFARMQGSSREAVKAQMVNAAALLEKIGEFDPKVHKTDGPKEMQ